MATTFTTALVARDLVKSYRGRRVLDGVDVLAPPGRRLGVIGENGVGKSTLLRLLAGVEAPDAGLIEGPRERVYLGQETSFGPTVTLGQAMAAALEPLHRAVQEVERLSARLVGEPELAVEFATVLEWAQSHDAWDADRRATIAAHRLGLARIEPDRPVATLSGGQRSRLALALIMTGRPTCLLLDEPTNHLDDGALELLEQFLVGLATVVVVASHDRVFLDRACTDLLDLDPAKSLDGRSSGVRYHGGYSSYLEHKAAARVRWETTYAEQQEAIAALRRASKLDTASIAHNRGPTDNDKFIYKFKGASVERSHARRLHNARRRLAVAERTQVPKPPRQLSFDTPLTSTPTGQRPVVAIRDLLVRGRVRVPRLELANGGQLLVTGSNGSGKSSLLAVIAGTLSPDSGSVEVGARRVGLLMQDVQFDNPELSAQRCFERQVGADRASCLTELGLLPPRQLGMPVGELSVGQRRRLALAILVARAPDLLLLDEPTNHISLALAGELEQALQAAAGAVLVASHDRWLRRRWSAGELSLRCV